MWRISFWLFFSIGYIIINNSIKADFNPYRPNRLHFLPYFNPRSPCGERPVSAARIRVILLFQSTLPVRGATPLPEALRGALQFQSTLPVRGATGAWRGCPPPVCDFNPRSPCGERHHTGRTFPSYQIYFNPRSPCGERLCI